jgi:transposase-like protein
MDNLQVFNDINPTTFHPNDPLQEILRDGARKILQTAIENEVNEYLAVLKNQRDSLNRQIATRNGYLPKRTIDTGLGPIPVQQPRVRHRDGGKFTSAILPPYLKRTRSIDALIPALYLKGISTSDFPAALEAILGKEVKGLSSTNIVRLKECWEQEYRDWLKKDLSEKTYVYIWADGVYFNVRLGDERPCVLVIIGALENGKKEILAIHDGQRESKISWKEVIQNLKSRGLKKAPKLAVGDGALGFWAALEEFPETKQERCWVHKTANILDKMPKIVQGNAKSMIHEIYNGSKKNRQYKGIGNLYRHI